MNLCCQTSASRGIPVAVMLRYLWSPSAAEIHLPRPLQLVNSRVQPGPRREQQCLCAGDLTASKRWQRNPLSLSQDSLALEPCSHPSLKGARVLQVGGTESPPPKFPNPRPSPLALRE